ncbi:MAG: VOC family protein [Deinococcus sp.]|nr:VOC family protein [Deinococcus sp.]
MTLHHIGITVDPAPFGDARAALETAAKPYVALGYGLEAQGLVETQGVYVYLLKPPSTNGIETRIELIAPANTTCALAKSLQKRGPGLHHLAFGVPDIREAMATLTRQGAKLVDLSPRPGFGGHLVAFVHPSFAGGVLLELVEEV